MEIVEFSSYFPHREMTWRLDVYLAAVFAGRSRAYLQRLIDEGSVTVDGVVLSKHQRIREHMTIRVTFRTEQMRVEAEDIPIDVVFENDDFAIINKESGMNVHPVTGAGGKHGTLVNALLHHFGSLSVINGIERPGIVHRLDKDTSGLLIIAKNDRSMHALQVHMNRRTIDKRYLAIVAGIVREPTGRIESYIGRDPHPESRQKMTVHNPVAPRLALTEFRTVEYIDDRYTLVEVHLLTGRTHQIRVHFTSIGHPIIGDSVYGDPRVNEEVLRKYGIARQWLHAYSLKFRLFNQEYAFIGRLKDDLLRVPFGAYRG